MDKEKIISKIESFFKEEVWGRVNINNIQISRLKTIEEVFNNVINMNYEEEIIQVCIDHIDKHGLSVTAYYMIGLIAFHKNEAKNRAYLIDLLDLLKKSYKWPVIEYVSLKILEYGENKTALKSLSESLEKLNRKKEAIPIWEEIIKLNRFEAEVAKKLSIAIADDDAQRSIYFLKLSFEGFIKQGNFVEVEEMWRRVVDTAWEDLAYFERIDRLILENQKNDFSSSISFALYEKYKDTDVDKSIDFLKKVLKQKPTDVEIRRKLIKLFEKKYEGHTQLKRFMEMSKLNVYSVPAIEAIKLFEKNIVLDTNNYVFHRTWGLGKIEEIVKDDVIVNFDKKENHKMSINMALQSLMPISKDHIYVQQFHDPDKINKLFEDDIMTFFSILIRSYNNSITVADIKRDLIPKYLDQKNWSKWWNKTRVLIKKSPLYGFSESQKDTIVLRDKPVTLADELMKKFASTESFSSRLDITYEYVNNVDDAENSYLIDTFIEYFIENTKGTSATKLILSYFILNSLMKYSLAEKINLDETKKKVITYIKDSKEISVISKKISSYDNKKEFINLIVKSREDYIDIITEILFETPVRIHRYIFNILLRNKAYKEINRFIDRIISQAKEFPEIFLWISRNILMNEWNWEWLDYSKSSLVLSLFRLMNDLKKIELYGNRMKNTIYDMIFGSESEILNSIVNEFDELFLNKIYDIASSVDFVDDPSKEKMVQVIKSKYPDFKPKKVLAVSDDLNIDAEVLIVTKKGYDSKAAELHNLINTELVRIQKDLSDAASVTGDVRENGDYNSLVEKQTILKKSISKLDGELKKAKIIEFDKISNESVSIGSTVSLEDTASDEKIQFTILGPWDADFENKILSYRSDVAKKLLRKKIGDEVEIRLSEFDKKYRITEISKYSVI